MIKYNNASHAFMLTVVKLKLRDSPVKMLIKKLITPATKSCTVAFASSESPVGLYLEYNDPVVQAMPPRMITSIANRDFPV